MLVNQVPCPLTEDPERSEAVPPIYCQLHWINYSAGPSGRGKERFIHKKETTWSSCKHISLLISINTPLALSWPTWRLVLLILKCHIWRLIPGEQFLLRCDAVSGDRWLFYEYILLILTFLTPCSPILYLEIWRLIPGGAVSRNMETYSAYFWGLNQLWFWIRGLSSKKLLVAKNSMEDQTCFQDLFIKKEKLVSYTM